MRPAATLIAPFLFVLITVMPLTARANGYNSGNLTPNITPSLESTLPTVETPRVRIQEPVRVQPVQPPVRVMPQNGSGRTSQESGGTTVR